MNMFARMVSLLTLWAISAGAIAGGSVPINT